MARILFCRHGQSEANVLRIMANRGQPFGLTETGRAQAAELAERLARENIRTLWASHILRAQQTAAIISARLGLPILTTNVLRDFDCGECEGRGDDAAWAAHDALIEAWDNERDYERRIPGGESYNDIRARFVPFVQSLIETHAGNGRPDGDLAVIMHGSVMAIFLPMVCRNLSREFVKTQLTRNCCCVVTELRGGALWCLDWDGARPK